jgi:WD40 repeat protein
MITALLILGLIGATLGASYTFPIVATYGSTATFNAVRFVVFDDPLRPTRAYNAKAGAAVTGYLLSNYNSFGSTAALAVTTNGHLAFGAGLLFYDCNKAVCVVNGTTFDLVNSFTGHTSTINEVMFYSSNNTVAAASVDSTVMMWSLSGALLQTWTLNASVTTALVVQDRNLFSVGSDGNIKYYANNTFTQLYKIGCSGGAVARVFPYGPNMTLLACRQNPGRFFIFDLTTLSRVSKATGKTTSVYAQALIEDTFWMLDFNGYFRIYNIRNLTLFATANIPVSGLGTPRGL